MRCTAPELRLVEAMKKLVWIGAIVLIVVAGALVFALQLGFVPLIEAPLDR